MTGMGYFLAGRRRTRAARPLAPPPLPTTSSAGWSNVSQKVAESGSLLANPLSWLRARTPIAIARATRARAGFLSIIGNLLIFLEQPHKSIVYLNNDRPGLAAL